MARRSKVARWVKRGSTLLLLMAIGAVLLFSQCEQFGAVPSGSDHQRMTESPNYNPEKDIFVNETPGVIDEMLSLIHI